MFRLSLLFIPYRYFELFGRLCLTRTLSHPDDRSGSLLSKASIQGQKIKPGKAAAKRK
jgi:hypothetical protein